MDHNNATEKCNTNLESSEPGLQNRLYLKLLGPTLESKKWLRKCYYVMLANTVRPKSNCGKELTGLLAIYFLAKDWSGS